MNEITRISLASLPYNISLEAKKQLEKYLQAVEKNMQADNDTMREIEARVVELLAARGVVGEKVIDSADVAAVKKLLGQPSDFVDESQAEHQPAQTKRVMRDESRALLGGVCAGLAAYFNVDVVWVRLATALVTVLSGGGFILVYLIAWFVTPPARTATERLQMAGKPVTLESLQEESTLLSQQGVTNRRLLKALRIVAGLGFLGLGLATLIGLAVTTWSVLARYYSLFTSEIWLYSILIGSAGALFVIFCWVIAYMLLSAKLTRRLMILLGVLCVLGIGSFATGLSLISIAQQNHAATAAQTTTKDITLDKQQLAGLKTLRVDATQATVTYHVSSESPRATLTYASKHDTLPGTIRLEGNTLRVPDTISGCVETLLLGCSVFRPQLHVYGPALEKLEAMSGEVVYENNAPQAQLDATVYSNTRLSLQGNGVLEKLALTQQTDSTLHSALTRVNAISLKPNAGTTTNLFSAGTVDIVGTIACSEYGGPVSVTSTNIGVISINGIPYDLGSSTTNTPCLHVAITPPQR